MRFIGILTLSLLLAASSQAHESDRELQMKAANDELTKRVAELLDENAKLKAHVASILKQMREAPSSSASLVVGGCNPQSIYDQFMLEFSYGNRNELIESFLKSNGRNCSEADFKFIEGLYTDFYPTFRTKELIKYYRNTR